MRTMNVALLAISLSGTFFLSCGGEIPTYEPVTIARNSGLGWNKGTTVILLDDAEGNTWVMKGFELGLEPQYTYNEFLAAMPGVYQKLPEGWKVRVKTLEEDLI